MAKTMSSEDNLGRYVHKRANSLRVLTRLLNHELELAQGKEVVLDREVMEETVGTIEIFLEDFSTQYTQQAGVAVAEHKMVEASSVKNRAN